MYVLFFSYFSLIEVWRVADCRKGMGGGVSGAEEKKQRKCANKSLKREKDVSPGQMNPENVDAFIICGGEINNIRNKPLLLETINRCIGEKKIVGGICAGRTLIADAAGGLEFSETTCVLENIVLSPGNEYVDFALGVGKAAHIFADEADYQETVDYFKYFKYIGN